MQMIVLTETELDRLYGEPADVLKLYVCLRRRMDFATGLVGAESGVSWWALREDMHVHEAQGRRREDSGTPSEKMVRNKVDRLVKVGLVESRTIRRKLVLFLPLAHVASARAKKVGQTLGRQAGQTLEGFEGLEPQGFEEDYPQEAGQTGSSEVGHTSGIRVNNISENKQQHTDWPVDNFEADCQGDAAALRFAEIVGWLRSAEKRRGKVVAVRDADPVVKSWVCRGVDAAALEAAHALAVADREKYGNPAPIHAGFLDLFVGRVVGKVRPWFESWSGIEATGAFHGIGQLPGESPQDFKRRVFAAAGVDLESLKCQA